MNSHSWNVESRRAVENYPCGTMRKQKRGETKPEANMMRQKKTLWRAMPLICSAALLIVPVSASYAQARRTRNSRRLNRSRRLRRRRRRRRRPGSVRPAATQRTAGHAVRSADPGSGSVVGAFPERRRSRPSRSPRPANSRTRRRNRPPAAASSRRRRPRQAARSSPRRLSSLRRSNRRRRSSRQRPSSLRASSRRPRSSLRRRSSLRAASRAARPRP